MSTLTISSADAALRSRRSSGTAAASLKARHARLAFASTAACLATLVLATALVHGYQASRPQPDLITFAFRV